MSAAGLAGTGAAPPAGETSRQYSPWRRRGEAGPSGWAHLTWRGFGCPLRREPAGVDQDVSGARHHRTSLLPGSSKSKSGSEWQSRSATGAGQGEADSDRDLQGNTPQA
jgi:hypothetical protein